MWLGTWLGLASAVLYTASNVYLRKAVDCDPVWVSCMKALPAALVAWALIAWGRLRGQSLLPARRLVLPLIVTAIVVHVGGNVSFQTALGSVGLALTVPLCFGTMIVGGAVMGRFWLAESITPRSLAAMAVLIVAIVVLSLGAGAQPAANAEQVPFAWIVAGVALACLSGVTYAGMTTVIRRLATGKTPVVSILTVVSTTGFFTLGALAMVRVGPSAMAATTGEQWWAMAGAGIFNAAAFFALAYALKHITVLQINIVSASQVALAAAAGVAFFAEPSSPALLAGCLLTVVGMLLVQGRVRDRALEATTSDASPESIPAPSTFVPSVHALEGSSADEPSPANVPSEVLSPAASARQPAVSLRDEG